MVLAVALIALSISSKIPARYVLSLVSIRIGIAEGAAILKWIRSISSPWNNLKSAIHRFFFYLKFAPF